MTRVNFTGIPIRPVTVELAERHLKEKIRVWWHKAGRPVRRRALDLATGAWWMPCDALDLPGLLERGIRVTDGVTKHDADIRALLTSCDELGVAPAATGGGVPMAILRLATTIEVPSGQALEGRHEYRRGR